MGEATLACWLLSPATIEQVRARQEAVIELRDKLDLREDLAVLGGDAGIGVSPKIALAVGRIRQPSKAALAPGSLPRARCSSDRHSHPVGIFRPSRALRCGSRCGIDRLLPPA